MVIIEHNLEVIKTADWLIDVGPEAGGEGGQIVAAGPPEVIAQTPGSLTGAILKDVLAAGPFAERPRFDPKAAAKKLLAEAKAAATATGPAPKPAWETDGRLWHTRDRISRGGKPARWDGSLLDQVVDRLAAIGGFAPADWSSRSLVRVGTDDPNQPPFFLAQTGHEWVVTLRFLVKRGTFKPEVLTRLLNLNPFYESSTPILSTAERVSLGDLHGLMQEVVLTTHSADDLATDAFDAFLVQAAISYQRAYGVTNTNPIADDSPTTPGWKVLPPPEPKAKPKAKPKRRAKT